MFMLGVIMLANLCESHVYCIIVILYKKLFNFSRIFCIESMPMQKLRILPVFIITQSY